MSRDLLTIGLLQRDLLGLHTAFFPPFSFLEKRHPILLMLRRKGGGDEHPSPIMAVKLLESWVRYTMQYGPSESQPGTSFNDTVVNHIKKIQSAENGHS